MRRALLSAGVLLVAGAPATAAASPFGEVGFRAAGGTATCLRATGYPGELVRSTRTGVQFLQAGAGGLVPVADVGIPTQPSSCPQVAARPNGAGVLAVAARSETGSGDAVRVALREPGGAWGAQTELVPPFSSFGTTRRIVADISDRGDALVAFGGSVERNRLAVRAFRRAPGAGFGAAQTLYTLPKRGTTLTVQGGVSASGDAVVAWSFLPSETRAREVWAAIAPDGAAFGTAVKIGTLRGRSPFSLAVGAGGHAVLVFGSGGDVLVAERGPGAGFGPATSVGPTGDRIAVFPAAAVRPDGGAIVVWQNSPAGDVHAVLRAQPGPFGPPVTLASLSRVHLPKVVLDAAGARSDGGGWYSSNAASPDDEGGFPRALIASDGRAVVTMESLAQQDGVYWAPPLVTTVPLSGGVPEQQVLGTPLRDVGSVTPLVTASGTVGVAWADNGERDRDGRLHLALEGAADGADPAAPAVRVIAPERRVLKADEDLRFAIRCSAACDLRVQLGEGALAPSATASLTRAGVKRIRLSGFSRPLATLRGGPVRIHVFSGAPGTRRAATRTVTFNLRRLPDAPRPRVLGAVARRDGEDVVVTWRSDRDAKPSNFAVLVTETRTGSVSDSLGSGDVKGSGRSFSARIQRVGKARYVHVVALAKGARKYDTTTVRVRG